VHGAVVNGTDDGKQRVAALPTAVEIGGGLLVGQGVGAKASLLGCRRHNLGKGLPALHIGLDSRHVRHICRFRGLWVESAEIVSDRRLTGVGKRRRLEESVRLGIIAAGA
jgi:hypothetical protein